jgi:hypothetical protein
MVNIGPGTEFPNFAAPLHEPEITHTLFVDGIVVETVGEGVVRLLGWQNAEGDRRIVARFVIADWTARKLVAQLQGSFGPQH